ncbi:PucR family transcriptional regulator ligand-binding domain-containing protein [Actinocatenispora rupis]
MRIRTLLDMPDLRLRLLTGDTALDRQVRWVYTTDLRDPRRYLDGGELVLTGMMWRRDPADSERFVAALAAGHVAALAAGYGGSDLAGVPDDLVDACRKHDVVLLEVPAEVSFAAVTERVARELSAGGDGPDAGAARWRDALNALVVAGAGTGAVCALLSDETGMDCWLLSAGGRLVAGADGLPAGTRTRLARAYLSADALPRRVRVDGGTYTLIAVAPRQQRIAGWCLALRGDVDTAPPYAKGAVTEVCTLLALEWSRYDEALAVAARQGEHLVAPAASAAETASRLAVAGFDADELVAVTAAYGEPGVPVLRELCAGLDGRWLVTRHGEEAVAVVPVALDRYDALLADLRARAATLSAGIGGCRLGIGVSTAAAASGLPAAADEARHLCRLGHRAPGRIRVTDSGELTSHTLLLSSVPDDLRRSFRGRLLGPLLDYDTRHHTELAYTLEVFLACDGSWTRTAERLHLHVNTLRYRIGRIERLTGRDLSRFTDRVDLYLALRTP